MLRPLPQLQMTLSGLRLTLPPNCPGDNDNVSLCLASVLFFSVEHEEEEEERQRCCCIVVLSCRRSAFWAVAAAAQGVRRGRSSYGLRHLFFAASREKRRVSLARLG